MQRRRDGGEQRRAVEGAAAGQALEQHPAPRATFAGLTSRRTIPARWTQLTAPLEELERIDEARVLSAFAGWSEDLRGLVAAHDGPLFVRAIHALPVGHRWPRVPGAVRWRRARAGDRHAP